jgi:hypothetical protein
MNETRRASGKSGFVAALVLCGTGTILGIIAHGAPVGSSADIAVASAVFSFAGLYVLIRNLVQWK